MIRMRSAAVTIAIFIILDYFFNMDYYSKDIVIKYFLAHKVYKYFSEDEKLGEIYEARIKRELETIINANLSSVKTLPYYNFSPDGRHNTFRIQAFDSWFWWVWSAIYRNALG